MTTFGFASNDWSRTVLNADGYPTWGGSGHYRMGLPAEWLRRRGHRVEIGTLIGDRATGMLGISTWDGRKLRGFDVLVLHRWMNQELVDAMERAVQAGQLIINDVDDYFWKLDRRNVAHWHTDPRRDPTDNREHYLRILKASPLVTCSTPYLADRLREMGVEPVKVLRNAIDLERWDVHDVTREPATVGWIGALPWRSGDLETLRGTLDAMIWQHDWNFHHGGHLYGGENAADGFGITKRPTSQASWCGILDYPRLWEALDIAVIPLSMQPFNFAKSCIKGMEAAASGVPFVAAATPEYEWLARRGVGRVARNAKEWRRELTRLADPEERAQQAKQNREGVEALNITTRVTDWEAVYERLHHARAGAASAT